MSKQKEKINNNQSDQNSNSSIQLHEALNKLSSFILDKSNENLEHFSSHQLGSFKNHHEACYKSIKSVYGLEIKTSNLLHALSTIYEKLEPTFIKNSSFKLLEIITTKKPNLSGAGIPSNIILEKFNRVKEKVVAPYTSTNLDIQTPNLDSRIVNDTIINEENNFNVESVKKDFNYKRIRSLIGRIEKKENDIKILQFHLNNDTTPSQLFYKNFPEPFLSHDSIFIERYNNFIHETQKGMINLSITRLSEQVNLLKENQLKHKNELVKNFSENNIEKINELLSELEKKQIEIFKNDFTKADEKAKRIVARPFVVKQSKKESDPKEKEVESDIIFDGEVKARKSRLIKSKNQNFKSNTEKKIQKTNNQNNKVVKNTRFSEVKIQNNNIQNIETNSNHKANQNHVYQNKNKNKRYYYRNFGQFSNYSNNFSYNCRNTNLERQSFHKNYHKQNFHRKNFFNNFKTRENYKSYQQQYNAELSDRGECQGQFRQSFNNNRYQHHQRPLNFRRTFMNDRKF